MRVQQRAGRLCFPAPLFYHLGEAAGILRHAISLRVLGIPELLTEPYWGFSARAAQPAKNLESALQQEAEIFKQAIAARKKQIAELNQQL